MPTPDPLLQRRKPTEQELEAEATVTPADIDNAVALFNQHCPPHARGMLDARPEEKK